MVTMDFIEITSPEGQLAEPLWLAKAESVHRELRHQLCADYAAHMQRVFAGGARMVVAAKNGAVLGVAVWRAFENTYAGLHLYVDDLVTEEASRSSGVGHALLEWLAGKARELGASSLALDSGTQRMDAHRFYLRERFDITSFHFRKPL